MKKLNQGLIAALVLSLLVGSVHAIEGLKLTIRCPDVVLSWPSVEGENYIVQWRETLSTNTPWVTLTNYLPAEVGTNITTFTHSNRVDCSAGQVFGMMSRSSSASELLSLAATTLTLAERATIKQVREEARISALLEKCAQEGREPYAWELKNQPPLPPSPEEVREKMLAARAARLSGATSLTVTEEIALNGPITPGEGNEVDGSGSGTEPGTGFYQVVRDGVHVVSITNLTNGVLSGTIPILIEAGNADYYSTDVRGRLGAASIIIDGEKFGGEGTIGAPPAYPWQFTMDTGFIENGDHTFQVQVTWKDQANIDANRKTLSRWSNPITISVSNVVYYPEWEPEVGEADIVAFYLKTVYPEAAFQIVITDVNSNYVQTLGGYATNGVIEAYWNMTDTNGVIRTNALTDSLFNSQTVVQASGGGSATKNNPSKKQRPKDWPDHGRWVVAYQDYFKYNYSPNNAQKGSINAFALTAQKFGGYVLYYPPPGETNDIGQTYPVRYIDANHPDPNIDFAKAYRDERMLARFLGNTNSRNFYYDGHGTADEILETMSAYSLTLDIRHRYRFVFLNSCNSANGTLDASFGIKGPKRFDIDYYRKSGLRPAAFMGYSEEVSYGDGQPVLVNGVQYDSTIPWQVPGFITNFLFYWDTDLMGYGLLSAVDSAKSGLPPVQGQYRENYLKIFGYYNLHIDEVNRRTDTW